MYGSLTNEKTPKGKRSASAPGGRQSPPRRPASPTRSGYEGYVPVEIDVQILHQAPRPLDPDSKQYTESLQVLENAMPLAKPMQVEPVIWSSQEVLAATAPRAGLGTPWLIGLGCSTLVGSTCYFSIGGKQDRWTVATALLSQLAGLGIMLPVGAVVADAGFPVSLTVAGLLLISASSCWSVCSELWQWDRQQQAYAALGAGCALLLIGALSATSGYAHPYFRTQAFGVITGCLWSGQIAGLALSSTVGAVKLQICLMISCVGAAAAMVHVARMHPLGDLIPSSSSTRLLLGDRTTLCEGVIMSAASCASSAFLVLLAGRDFNQMNLNIAASMSYLCAAAGTCMLVQWLRGLVNVHSLIAMCFGIVSVASGSLWCLEAPAPMLTYSAPLIAAASAVTGTLSIASIFASFEHVASSRPGSVFGMLLAFYCVGQAAGAFVGATICENQAPVEQMRGVYGAIAVLWGCCAAAVRVADLMALLPPTIDFWPKEQQLAHVQRGRFQQPQQRMSSLTGKHTTNVVQGLRF